MLWMHSSMASAVMSDESLARVTTAVAAMRCNSSKLYDRVGGVKPASNGRWRNLLPTIQRALDSAGVVLPEDVRAGDVYQFGVFQGMSIRMLKGMDAFSSSFVWGFDSFKGLPTEDRTSPQTGMWQPGQFKADPRAALRAELGADRIDFVLLPRPRIFFFCC